jgi:hypothetical protein
MGEPQLWSGCSMRAEEAKRAAFVLTVSIPIYLMNDAQTVRHVPCRPRYGAGAAKSTEDDGVRNAIYTTVTVVEIAVATSGRMIQGGGRLEGASSSVINLMNEDPAMMRWLSSRKIPWSKQAGKQASKQEAQRSAAQHIVHAHAHALPGACLCRPHPSYPPML